MATLGTPSSGTAGHVSDHGVLNDRHNRNVTVHTIASSGAAQTLNGAAGIAKVVTLTANCAFTFSAPPTSEVGSLELVLKQDATGSRTVTWPASVKWSGGAPSLSTAANAVDRLVFVTYDCGTTWYGDLIG